ncbi:hypothetical protein BB561_006844 [Smittium simulii]|uniref:Pacifastin domain-containing protein n=1 Tax=Smittium simulii TaxID=133385 RepID=A0A2T9Y0X3_9FUNG|nr:hypothetical protein BB561_006844 [Smittium simulii]
MAKKIPALFYVSFFTLCAVNASIAESQTTYPDGKKTELETPKYLECVKKNGKDLYQSADNKCDVCICTPEGYNSCLEIDCNKKSFKKNKTYKKCLEIFKQNVLENSGGELCTKCQCIDGTGIAFDSNKDRHRKGYNDHSHKKVDSNKEKNRGGYDDHSHKKVDSNKEKNKGRYGNDSYKNKDKGVYDDDSYKSLDSNKDEVKPDAPKDEVKPDDPKDEDVKPDAKENLDIKNYNICVSKNGKSVFESAEDKCNSCMCTEIGKVCCLKTKCEDPNFNKTEKYKACIKNFGSKNFPYPAGECSQLRQELSLTDLNIKTAVARTRAFGKWASLRTWISDLIKCPYKH